MFWLQLVSSFHVLVCSSLFELTNAISYAAGAHRQFDKKRPLAKPRAPVKSQYF